MSLKIIDFFRSKKMPFMLGMSWLSTDFARRAAFCISRWLDNIRRWRFGRVGRILREFGNLVSKFSSSAGVRSALNNRMVFESSKNNKKFKKVFSAFFELLWAI